MKQAALGILVIVMIVLVFSAESILAVLRVRNVDVTVHVLDARTGVIATPQAAATAAAGQAAPSAVLTFLPGETLEVQTHWDYRIGPRFPQTILYAEVLDQNNMAIATDQYTVDCGSETLNCQGDHTLKLDYTGSPAQSTSSTQQAQTGASKPHVDWPVGDYTLHVTRTYTGLKPQDVVNESFHIRAAR